MLEVQGWGYIKRRNNQVSAQEPLIERSAFRGDEKSMCVGIPGVPIIIILGQILNRRCDGFGWGKCLQEAVFEVHLISPGGNKHLYLQIMHFLGGAFVWALHTPAKWEDFCFALVGRARFIFKIPGILLSRCVTMHRPLSLSVSQCPHFWGGVNSPAEEQGEEKAPFDDLASLGLDFKMLSVPTSSKKPSWTVEAGWPHAQIDENTLHCL